MWFGSEPRHLSVAAGDSVALWGPNGAGKTTVIRCLLGLVSYEGEITVTGLDARTRGKAVRSLIGYVPQELLLFNQSILMNVTLGDPALSRTDVERALQQAGAWGFMSNVSS